jgi:peptide/nickel transport system substrate-binding protein
VEQAKFGGNLKVVAQSSIKSIDCDYSTAYVCGAVHLHFQEGLGALDDNFDPQPQLLDSWDISGDGLTYTMTLREGPTFHNDGLPITTDDAIASIKRWIINRPGGKALSAFLAGGPDGLAKVNDSTFTMTMSEPYGPNITHLSLLRGRAIMWPKEIADLDPKVDVGSGNYIGTGPYFVVKHEAGNKVLLERYEAYVPRSEPHSNFAGAQISYVDTIEWLEVPAEETKVAGLLTGEWDIIDGLSLDFYEDMLENPDINVALDKPGKKSAISLNHSLAPMDTREFRMALLRGIDPEAFMRSLGPQSLWTLCATLFHCGTPLESHAGDAYYNNQDLAESKKLLKESGYAGEPILLMNPSDYGTITPLGPVFKAQMEEIGVVVEMPGMDWSTLVSHIGELDYWHAHTTWHGFYGVHDPINEGWIRAERAYFDKNPKAEDLANRWVRSLDPKERMDLIDQLELEFWQDVGWLGLGQFFLTTPYRGWVKGLYEIKGMQNYHNIWLEK